MSQEFNKLLEKAICFIPNTRTIKNFSIKSCGNLEFQIDHGSFFKDRDYKSISDFISKEMSICQKEAVVSILANNFFPRLVEFLSQINQTQYENYSNKRRECVFKIHDDHINISFHISKIYRMMFNKVKKR